MDIRILKELVAEVLVIVKNDDSGRTWDLYDVAMAAGAELEMSKEELDKIYDNA